MMETIHLTIPNMKSPHCMMVVSGALKSVPGASLKRVAPGEADVELSGTSKETVVAAIEHAGYQVTNK